MELNSFTVGQIEMLLKWRPIVEAAGLYSPEHHPTQLLLLAGAIMHDKIVGQLWLERMKTFHPTDDKPFAFGVYESVLSAMSLEEKAALKQRIIDSLQYKPKQKPVTALG